LTDGTAGCAAAAWTTTADWRRSGRLDTGTSWFMCRINLTNMVELGQTVGM